MNPDLVKAITRLTAEGALIAICLFLVWDDKSKANAGRERLIESSIKEATASERLASSLTTHFENTDLIVGHLIRSEDRQKCIVKLAIEQDIDALRIARCFDLEGEIPERRLRRR
jgi:hypothetical protein